MKIFRYEKLEEIPKADNNNDVSTPNDHYTRSSSELLVEPLMTLIESLSKKEKVTIGDPKTLSQHLKYIDLNLLESQLVLKLYLDLIVEEELLAIKRISHIMVPCKKYFEEEPESYRELQIHIKIQTEIG